MSLLSVGTVAFDEIETPFGKSGKILGGAAPYISLAASKLVAQTNIVSVIGDDFPDEYLNILKENHCNTDGIKRIPEGKTFFWVGKYHMDMNFRDTLRTDLNVLENFKPELPDNYKNPEVVMLGNLHPKVQMEIIEQLNNRPFIVMDTMNYWMDRTWDELMAVMKRVDVLSINDEEARQMSEEYSLKKAANKILTMGPKFLIIKKGEHGALLFGGDEVFFAPALPLEEVFDPTGAGDTFAGGFSGYLADTLDFSFENMKRAVIYGSALASFIVEKFGVQRLLEINELDIQNRIDKFKKLSYFDLD
ncbi:sugar kinase [Ornithobacterium rhinotracheale]|uniref:Sugar kinase n=1 Tax=Ornithobacterium rhinotracheale TaxID=28251 RepID=A0A410JP13_ORNRH|nr:PfkB family carbohydrate kinase [Ornithobacterium rhinotracheale]QAR29877.1 sugar kinase [Ornithobacterium rhinotracheale]